MISVWTAWTSPRRSSIRLGTRTRTSLPSLPLTISTSSRTNSTPRCISEWMSAAKTNEFTPNNTQLCQNVHTIRHAHTLSHNQEMPKTHTYTHNQNSYTAFHVPPSPPPQPSRTARPSAGLGREQAGLHNGLWIAKLSEQWIAAARLPEGRDHTLGPRVERRLHVRLLLFFNSSCSFTFFPPPPPPPLLSVFVCSSKSYSYPLPTVLCNKNPLWLSTSGTDKKWGIYITGCLF